LTNKYYLTREVTVTVLILLLTSDKNIIIFLWVGFQLEQAVIILLKWPMHVQRKSHRFTDTRHSALPGTQSMRHWKTGLLYVRCAVLRQKLAECDQLTRNNSESFKKLPCKIAKNLLTVSKYNNTW